MNIEEKKREKEKYEVTTRGIKTKRKRRGKVSQSRVIKSKQSEPGKCRARQEKEENQELYQEENIE